MRFLIKAEMPVEAGNVAIKNGTMAETIGSILDDLKPEAAYFLASNGKRTALLFIDVQDASQIPKLAEPWFLAFDAAVEILPVMVPEDLEKAGAAMARAAKKYG